jgi:hypothetical protein
MNNFLKYSIAAGAAMALAGSVYATPTIVITDGTAGLDATASSASGDVTLTASGDGWNVVIAVGLSEPPQSGGGTASRPSMDLSITATYSGNGTQGNPLNIYFGGGTYGPTSSSFLAQLSGHMASGTGLPVTFTTYTTGAGAAPSTTSPYIPAGSTQLTTSGAVSLSGGLYSSIVHSAGVSLSSYGLLEDLTISGSSAGSSYSLDASLTAVPDGGMTLMLLGSALSGLALLKKKLA